VSTTQSHQLIIALVFALACAFFVGYRILRPDARPRFTLLAALLCALVSFAFGRTALPGFDSYRAQVLQSTLVGVAVCFGWSVVCLKLTESLEAIDVSPRARAALRSCPYGLGAALLCNLAIGLAWPVPVLEFQAGAPSHYLPYKLVLLVPEAFYVTLAGYFFLKMSGPHVQVGRIRAQNYAFAAGSFFLTLITLNAIVNATVRAFAPQEVRLRLVEPVLRAELLMTMLFVTAFAIGAGLYHTQGERAKMLARFVRWVNARKALDQQLWSFAGSGWEGCAPALTYVERASEELLQRSQKHNEKREQPGFLAGDSQKALDALRILILHKSKMRLSIGTSPRELVFLLLRLHNYLLRESAMLHASWDIVRANGKHYAYSLASDPLLEPIEKTSPLLSGDPSTLNLLREPEWLQLASVAAAEEGLLPPTLTQQILKGTGVKRRVITAYENAKIRAQLLTFPGDGLS
jgi:hypothetical protein